MRARQPSLVRADPGADRALVGAVAILAFLAAVCAGIAESAVRAASLWGAALSSEATIQIRPRPGRDLDADLATAAALASADPAVLEARVATRSELEVLLEPWLGRGLDLRSLPVPGMVSLRLARPEAPLATLGERLAAIPGATLDDHARSVAGLVANARAVAAGAFVLVVAVLAACGLAVAFATRGVVAFSRETVEVLALVGADRGFVARSFAAHFLRHGLSAAGAGSVAAALLLASPHLLAHPGTLPGLVAIRPVGLAVVFGIAILIGATVWLSSAATVRRLLRRGSESA